MLISTTFVMLQTPAIGIAQAGLIQKKNVLSMLMQTMTGLVVGSLLWFLFGFSLTFGESIGGVIGDPSTYPFYTGLSIDEPMMGHSIPSIMFATFQMMFALMVPVILTGTWAEKLSFNAFLIIISVWPVLVYYPLAHWIWHPDGWLLQRGGVGFCGWIDHPHQHGRCGLGDLENVGTPQQFP